MASAAFPSRIRHSAIVISVKARSRQSPVLGDSATLAVASSLARATSPDKAIVNAERNRAQASSQGSPTRRTSAIARSQASAAPAASPHSARAGPRWTRAWASPCSQPQRWEHSMLRMNRSRAGPERVRLPPPSADIDLNAGAVALHDAVTALRSGAVDSHAFQHVIMVGHSPVRLQ